MRRESSPSLAARLREREQKPWSTIKKWITSGKVFVDGVRITDPGFRAAEGADIELRLAAPRPTSGPRIEIVFQDAHLVVIDKPSGVSSVPYERGERGTAIDLLRSAWRSRGESATGPILVVHRIDKETSGLMMFAREKSAEVGLARQLREHSVERRYECVAHGAVESQTIISHLVRDRGDGLRGSTRRRTPRGKPLGKRSVTHIQARQSLRGATLCNVTLETGRTHQIRIHLAEAGHPLVGDRVYTRDFVRDGKPLLESPRLLLHAATLGFQHPATGEMLRFESAWPGDFADAARKLGYRD
jgi:23S rRNA pseudouridine1911/1915/1917 synthase